MKRIIILGLSILVSAGCTITREIPAISPPPTFRAEITSVDDTNTIITCILEYSKPGSPIWENFTVEGVLSNAFAKLPYIPIMATQDMPSRTETRDASRFILSPIKFQQHSSSIRYSARTQFEVSTLLLKRYDALILSLQFEQTNYVQRLTNTFVVFCIHTIEQEGINARESSVPPVQIKESYFRPTGTADEYEWVRIFRYPDGRELNPGKLVLKVGQPAESRMSIPRQTPPEFIFTRTLLMSVDSTNAVVETSTSFGREKSIIMRYSVPIRNN